MPRRIRRFAILGLVLLLVVAVALVFTGRPRLEDDRDRVDESWIPLRDPLAQRYDQLGAVLDQLEQAGGGDRDVARELTRALDGWQQLSRASDDDAGAGAEAKAANTLEGLAVRVQRTVDGSPRLSTAQPLVDALAAFTASAPADDAVRAYNNAALDYQKTRGSLRFALVAELFGYEARPSLAVPSAIAG